MSLAGISWAPLLPWAVILVLAVLALLVVALAFWRRARGAWLRLAAAAVVLLALVNPSIVQEQRAAQPDIVLLVSDHSASMAAGDRAAVRDRALAGLRAELAPLGDLEIKEVAIESGPDRGSALAEAVERGLAEIDRARLAAVIAVTDGQVHDLPEPGAQPLVPAPLHVLLTGAPGERDRRLVIEQAPGYAMVGEPQSLTVRVDSTIPGETALPVTVRLDGAPIATLQALPGQSLSVPFRLERAGPAVIEVEAAVAGDELTPLNNRQTATITGVRDRLRVLLVSGQPYPGLRVWRNLLKADPSVDLVHFTILRPPEKQDGTPIRELALIAFPARELFEEKLAEFDMIIFDRYARRGLLPMLYLENVAQYVENGGALLEAAGPEFVEPDSLYRTPLARVLPGRPSGQVLEVPFRPQITETGQRHPVTAGLRGPDDPPWGHWLRQLDVETGRAQVVMTGAMDRPLLLLDRVGEGRVAQLVSDHHWLWARGFDGGGPQAVLLRRVVHWLMKEPELEEEELVAHGDGEGLVIRRQSLAAVPREVTLTSPSGVVSTHRLEVGADGMAQARIAAAEPGVWRIDDGEHVAYATARPVAAVELGDMVATDRPVRAQVEASGGAITWLGAHDLPDLREVAPGRQTAGRGWIGLVRNGAYRVVDSRVVPLLPAGLGLLLAVGLAAAAWWREGRA
jgi:hypothetical protein